MQTKKAQPKVQQPKQTRKEREAERFYLTKHLHPVRVEYFKGIRL